MHAINRRQFTRASAALLMLHGARVAVAGPNPALIRQSDRKIRVEGATYDWEWSAQDDQFRFLDKRGRLMAEGTLQPAVVVAPVGHGGVRRCSAGTVAGFDIKQDRVTVEYAGVNGSARISLTWRLDGDGAWLEPIRYDSTSSEDVVALHYFARAAADVPEPALMHNFLVCPGISGTSALSPIIRAEMNLHLTSWLGHGSFPGPGLAQQWGLPVHYFCGFHRNTPFSNLKGAMREGLSDAFCCGLAQLPAGDLYIETNHGRQSLIVSYRSDIWGQQQGPGPLVLGARLYWATGANYYEAIRHYYLGLVKAGIISKKINSSNKNAVIKTPQFNSWGAETAAGNEIERFDEAVFKDMFEGMKVSGLKAGMFVFDAKWQGKYGKLDPSSKRFPNLEKILEQLRREGYRFGFWTAFLRCEDPQDLGLTTDHMLRKPDGTPYTAKEDETEYYLIDFTQPEVEQVLARISREFARRYRPDLIKFDFGYELPPLSVAAPKNMAFGGEQLLLRGVEILVKAMREVNPDIAVIYYCLSPLFVDVVDLHCPDDLTLCGGDYDLEANRRLFFSSLLGELGMPTYGSGGYDWPTMPSIWFDSAVVGTLGSLNSFAGDEVDSGPTPARVAKYNGLSNLLRSSNVFTIEPLDLADSYASARGARASSWARREDGELVLLALRKQRLDGGPGTGRYGNVLETDASVVVASKTAESIARAAHLAIVPYGDGVLTLQRGEHRTGRASVKEHAFGGRIREHSVAIAAGRLRLPLRERAEDGVPIEWLEIVIQST